MADTVAREHTITELYIGSIKLGVKGKRNSKKPVILFKGVCRDTNFLLQINPQITFPVLMVAITATQIHNQVGSCINGRIFAEHTATNTISATVSNLAPNSLTVLVFLAIVPSTISVIPQSGYRI